MPEHKLSAGQLLNVQDVIKEVEISVITIFQSAAFSKIYENWKNNLEAAFSTQRLEAVYFVWGLM